MKMKESRKLKKKIEIKPSAGLGKKRHDKTNIREKIRLPNHPG